MSSLISVDVELVIHTRRRLHRTADAFASTAPPPPIHPRVPESRRFDAALAAWGGSCGTLLTSSAQRFRIAEAEIGATIQDLAEIDSVGADEFTRMRNRLDAGQHAV